MNNYKIDYINKKIILTKTFCNKASNINNRTEFEEMKMLRIEFSDFSFVMKQIKKNTSKNSHKNLTYKEMKEYIRNNDAERLELLEKVMANSHIQSSPYPYVKKWFLNQYPNYTKIENNENTEIAERNVA